MKKYCEKVQKRQISTAFFYVNGHLKNLTQITVGKDLVDKTELCSPCNILTVGSK
jgi:hypothetical protein